MIDKQPSKQPSLDKHLQKHIEKHIDKKLSQNMISRGELLSHLFKQHISTAIIAAFSFLMALAWKDLLVHSVTFLVNEEIKNRSPYIPDLISALAITLVAVIGIMFVTIWARRPHVIFSETATT